MLDAIAFKKMDLSFLTPQGNGIELSAEGATI
jgi:hypothetical protein